MAGQCGGGAWERSQSKDGIRPIFTEVSEILKSCGVPCERVRREMAMSKLSEQKEEGGPEKER